MRLELIIPLSLLTISAAVLVIKRLVKWVRKRCRDRNVAGEDVEMNVLGGEDEDESELQLYPPPVATATSFLPGFCHLFQQRRGGRNVVYIPPPHTSRGRGIARGMEHIERSMTGAMTHLIPPPHESFDSLSEFLKNKPESVAGAGGGDSSETLVEVDIGQGYASGSSSGSGNSSIFPGGYNDGSKKKRR
ncbi:MAG: hypothetical protein DRQ98_12880 [Gammaproteobacteria bacterium]|nr:MAG: hypothetical protein DRQ98_12880 [Gammaproteobacteria bacterium]